MPIGMPLGRLVTGTLPSTQIWQRTMAKSVELIGMYDDVYDVDGKLDELELFTEVNHNIDILPHQGKWINDLFKRYLVELRWYHSGYQPTLEEYLRNTFVTVAGPIVALYAYIYIANPINKEDLEFIEDFSDIIRLAYEIFRISDDYGTCGPEQAKGDVPSSVQCYMSDAGVSEGVSYERAHEEFDEEEMVANK
ncbi:hypothetical protein POM88_034732 [Heracleum sosnowskyi]|uniref:Terpene synthase metal-binding domain-containing protein n=1 Tax=Heracleum sosnowskyi TaxID=360622 RepID=A0AAD8MAT6_9APIA|nr:hypothetical protein POM88_034732 [Heracleum sosnowskyi]